MEALLLMVLTCVAENLPFHHLNKLKHVFHLTMLKIFNKTKAESQ